METNRTLSGIQVAGWLVIAIGAVVTLLLMGEVGDGNTAARYAAIGQVGIPSVALGALLIGVARIIDLLGRVADDLEGRTPKLGAPIRK
jgi:hypothetical protein